MVIPFKSWDNDDDYEDQTLESPRYKPADSETEFPTITPAYSTVNWSPPTYEIELEIDFTGYKRLTPHEISRIPKHKPFALDGDGDADAEGEGPSLKRDADSCINCPAAKKRAKRTNVVQIDDAVDDHAEVDDDGGGDGSYKAEKERLDKMKSDNEAQIRAAETELERLRQKKKLIDNLLNWYEDK